MYEYIEIPTPGVADGYRPGAPSPLVPPSMENGLFVRTVGSSKQMISFLL